jgi:hypothetical protein
VRIKTTYISDSHNCDELGYYTPSPDDSSLRFCTEIDAPLINYADVGDSIISNSL